MASQEASSKALPYVETEDRILDLGNERLERLVRERKAKEQQSPPQDPSKPE